ncbi:MAG: flavodoxin family protein [Flavonifractor plautii]
MCIEALMGAKEMGAEVEFIQLQNLHIEHCTGRTACVQSVLGGRGGKCVLKDDFDWSLDKMLDADGIVFSTPIFEKGATGLFHTITDRFGPRMDRGNNIIGTKIAEETGGTAPDPRILKDKVISFMSVGGSDWVTRTQCDAGMLALTPMWKVIDNEVFPWALSILVEDERVARAHQIGRNIAEAAKDIEHAQYQGDARRVPPLPQPQLPPAGRQGHLLPVRPGGRDPQRGRQVLLHLPRRAAGARPRHPVRQVHPRQRHQGEHRQEDCQHADREVQGPPGRVPRLYHRHRAREGLRRRVRDVRGISSHAQRHLCGRLQRGVPPPPSALAVRPPYSGFHL